MFMHPGLLRTFGVSYVKPNQIAVNSELVMSRAGVLGWQRKEFFFYMWHDVKKKKKHHFSWQSAK